MIKKAFEPFQVVLLNRRLCPGCTTPLDKSKERDQYTETKEMIQCKCKRRFLLDKSSNLFRRMSIEEERDFLKKRRKSS